MYNKPPKSIMIQLRKRDNLLDTDQVFAAFDEYNFFLHQQSHNTAPTQSIYYASRLLTVYDNDKLKGKSSVILPSDILFAETEYDAHKREFQYEHSLVQRYNISIMGYDFPYIWIVLVFLQRWFEKQNRFWLEFFFYVPLGILSCLFVGRVLLALVPQIFSDRPVIGWIETVCVSFGVGMASIGTICLLALALVVFRNYSELFINQLKLSFRSMNDIHRTYGRKVKRLEDTSDETKFWETADYEENDLPEPLDYTSDELLEDVLDSQKRKNSGS